MIIGVQKYQIFLSSYGWSNFEADLIFRKIDVNNIFVADELHDTTASLDRKKNEK